MPRQKTRAPANVKSEAEGSDGEADEAQDTKLQEPRAELTLETSMTKDSEETSIESMGDVTISAPTSEPMMSSIQPGTPTRNPLQGLGDQAHSTPVKVTVPVTLPTAPKTRLTIHKMVLQDFKSYAGRQEIGPFHKSFSAVVGPNGSGKSNVIDALLFVFGWRANKMRQGKLSELIHNSAGKESLPNCCVEVWFREIEDLPGPDAFRVVPGSRLIIARTAHRNNSSVYTINAKKSTFTEVTTLLKSRGIDLDHKRFLILQGEVESIAQMPPKGKTEHEEGLLEYLEDIVGTSELKAPIEAAAIKVDECNEQRSIKLERLKFVQKEKQSLEHKKREAEVFLRDQNELTQRQSALWQVYMLECREQMEVASASIQNLQARMSEELEKNGGIKAEVEETTIKLGAIEEQFKAAKQETDRALKELAKLEKLSLQGDEKLKHIAAKRKRVEKSLSDERRNVSEAKATVSDTTEQQDKLAAESSQLENSLEEEESKLEAVREGLRDKTQAFTAAIEVKQKELAPWTRQVIEQQNARGLAAEERALLCSREEQLQCHIAAAENNLRELDEDVGTKVSCCDVSHKTRN